MPPESAAAAGAVRADAAGDLVARLARHKTIGHIPRAELEWVASHGRLERYPAGQVVSAHAEPVSALFILLDGRITLHVNRGAGRHKVAEWRAGDVTGQLPYSRMVKPPGDTVTEEPTEAVAIPRECLPAMIRECHELTSTLVHVMVDRARHFTSGDLHDEKLMSLGKLAAGLAHELNNPAAAIRAAARLLPDNLSRAAAASRALGEAGLTDGERHAIEQIRSLCVATPAGGVRSPIEQSERENQIADWLEAHGVDSSAAETLAETPLPLDMLDDLTRSVRREVVDAVVQWLASDCAVRLLAREIEQAGVRISELVSAVKGFTQVDASTVARPVAIGQGLADTVAVLKAKARRKSITVTLDVDAALPPVRGVAGELNQIWANLIDNALDAAADGGRVQVRARGDGRAVVVSVIDDGAGIPPAIRERIFDPFFTTKDVGAGTGLGLDIVRRLVQRHDGEIEVESRPGRTEFRVCLPVAGDSKPEERE